MKLVTDLCLETSELGGRERDHERHELLLDDLAVRHGRNALRSFLKKREPKRVSGVSQQPALKCRQRELAQLGRTRERGTPCNESKVVSAPIAAARDAQYKFRCSERRARAQASSAAFLRREGAEQQSTEPPPRPLTRRARCSSKQGVIELQRQSEDLAELERCHSGSVVGRRRASGRELTSAQFFLTAFLK